MHLKVLNYVVKLYLFHNTYYSKFITTSVYVYYVAAILKYMENVQFKNYHTYPHKVTFAQGCIHRMHNYFHAYEL